MSFFRQDRIDTMERGSGRQALMLPVLFVTGLWFLKWAELRFALELPVWGIVPGDFRGLEFLLAPLIHGDLSHLFSNSVPLIVLAASVLYLYPRAAWKVFGLVYLGTSLLVFFFARGGPHIGASGINYGLVTFIFFSGMLRRDPPAVALALLVTFLYGSMVWGVLPNDPNISWESHLAGSLLGIFYAGVYRLTDPPPRAPLVDDEDDYDFDSDQSWRDFPHPNAEGSDEYYRGRSTPAPYKNPYYRGQAGLDFDEDEY